MDPNIPSETVAAEGLSQATGNVVPLEYDNFVSASSECAGTGEAPDARTDHDPIETGISFGIHRGRTPRQFSAILPRRGHGSRSGATRTVAARLPSRTTSTIRWRDDKIASLTAGLMRSIATVCSRVSSSTR